MELHQQLDQKLVLVGHSGKVGCTRTEARNGAPHFIGQREGCAHSSQGLRQAMGAAFCASQLAETDCASHFQRDIFRRLEGAMSERPEDVKELEKVSDPDAVAPATDTDNRELSDEELGKVSGGVSGVGGHRPVVVDSPL